MPNYNENYVVNMAFRNILIAYGTKLKYIQFKKTKHWEDILNRFDKICCYCGNINESLEADHIIGMNKSELGFDCLGNIAPACPSCNRKKNNYPQNEKEYGWKRYLKEVSINNNIYNKRKKRIEKYMEAYNYPPKNLKMNESTHKIIQRKLHILGNNIKKALEETIKKL